VLGRRSVAFTESLGLLLQRCGISAEVVDPRERRHLSSEVRAVVVCASAAAGPAGELIASLRKRRHDVRVIALDGRAIRGADVSLKPTVEVDELLRLLPVQRPRVAGVVSARHTRTRSRVAGNAASLTERERQLLRLISRGLSNDTIAEQLQISPHTVRTHVQNILMKLGARSRLEAAGMADAHLTYQAGGGLSTSTVDEPPPTLRQPQDSATRHSDPRPPAPSPSRGAAEASL
jgi:DNA-binding NarL/FixJ family response regulator